MPASVERVECPWGRGGPEVRFAPDVTSECRADVVSLLAGWNRELFPGDEIQVSVLVGGANNCNYVVESGRTKFALRVANLQNEKFAVDRDSAIRAQQVGAAGDLAPAVVASKLPEGHMLSVFIEGETLLNTERLKDPEILTLVGRTFRKLHALPADIRHYSPFDDIRLWSGFAKENDGELPEDFDHLLDLVGQTERSLLGCGLPTVLCHNDTVPQNLILSSDQLRLVDWDYAGMGWGCFEIASFAATADFDCNQREVLVGAYDPDATGEQHCRVEVLGLVALVREISWVLMATPILKGTTDTVEDTFYEDYLCENTARARAMVESETFKARLEEMKSWSKGLAW